MKAWLMEILATVIRAIFRKSPEERAEARQVNAYDDWQKELTRLTTATQEAENACENYMATAHAGDDSAREFARLRAVATECAKAEANHRAKRQAS